MTKSFLPTFARSISSTPLQAACVCLILGLTGCTTVGSWFGSDKADYRDGAQRTGPLEVPPDLTQLARDSRYLPQGGVVTASDLSRPAGANAPAPGASSAEVALNAIGDTHVERLGNERWIVTTKSPEEVWPALRTFWLEHGFKLTDENAAAGLLETDWREDKTHLPSNFIRNTLGKVVDGLFDSGLRDRYRTRVERGPQGTEIHVTHFGAKEEITGVEKNGTQWVPRDSDPGLEAEMMTAIMVSLGTPDASARASVATPAAPGAAASSASGSAPASSASAHARLLTDGPGAALQIDDGFDRAWRRVGLALDRGGFTVEDRDRAQGIYFVRFVDAKEAAKEEPGFFSRLFSFGRKPAPSPVGKYRVSLKADGASSSRVSVLNNQGEPDNSPNAQRIVGLLVEDLK